jgi:hypothetical protein
MTAGIAVVIARRRGACLALLTLLAVALSPAGRAGTGVPDEQLWTELDVDVPVTERITVTGVAQLRLSESLPNPSQTAGGLDIAYKDGEWTYGLGYRHQVTGDRVNSTPNVTQVLRLNTTYAHRFGLNTVAIRVRFEDTLTATSNPWRVRLRGEYRRATPDSGRIAYLFVNDEVYYEFFNEEWYRNRFQAGMNLRLGKRTDMDLYYQRQDTKNSTPGAINALCMTVTYAFD